MSLQTDERALYQDAWATIPTYADHSPGVDMLPAFLQMIGDARGHVLDAGCGSGKGALALEAAGFRVTCCDMTDVGLVDEARALPFREAVLWQSLKPISPVGSFDWVYCTDVLEHVPTQFTMLAAEQLLRVARQGVFLSVSLTSDVMGAWLGRPLHQTVQSFLWWKHSLSEVGRVVEARDMQECACFLVTR